MKKYIFAIVFALILALIVPITGVFAVSDPILYENYTTTNNEDVFYGNYYGAQTFTAASSHSINKVSLAFIKVGSPAGNIIVNVKNTDASGNPSGSNLATGTIAASTTSTSWSNYKWTDFNLNTNVKLTSGKKYAIIWSAPNSDSQNRLYYRINTSGTYSGGQVAKSYGGTTWSLSSTKSWDAVFKVWGTTTTTTTPATSTPTPTPTPTPKTTPTPTPPPTPTSTSSSMRIVGYTGALNSNVQLDKVTHVIAERVQLKSATDMTLYRGPLEYPISVAALQNIVSRCHAAGKPVLLELYSGWSTDKYQNVLFDSPALRARLISNLMAMVNSYGFDGVDLDWESETGATNLNRTSFSAFLAELKTALGTRLVTFAGAASVGDGGLPPFTVDCANNYIDFIDVMCYDYTNTWYLTSSDAAKSMNKWAATGISKSRLNMGISFAARPWTPYKNIVTASTSTADSAVSGYSYNGLTTVKTKTQWVKDNGFAGVMVYVLNYDTYDIPSRSLLKGIYDIAASDN